jgi:hypothetical protein
MTTSKSSNFHNSELPVIADCTRLTAPDLPALGSWRKIRLHGRMPS